LLLARHEETRQAALLGNWHSFDYWGDDLPTENEGI